MKILVLSAIYPAADTLLTGTSVVHFFTREWVKMGHEVRVAHLAANPPELYLKVAKRFSTAVSFCMGANVRTRSYPGLEYELEGVRVLRLPYRRLIPRSLPSTRTIAELVEGIVDYLKREGFAPDYIMAHWLDPCVRVMQGVREVFPARCTYVVHGVDVFGPSSIRKKGQSVLKGVDVVGFRSEAIRRHFENKVRTDRPSFICYSGVPDGYVDSAGDKSFDRVSRFVYVGTLIERKHSVSLVRALGKVFGAEDFSLTYVGTGYQLPSIRREAKRAGILDRVFFTGWLRRDEVVQVLDENQVFVMISSRETFGMVYLEAMARGCITVASRDEGFDGIITDGENGFLCRAGDSDELERIIRRIKSMDPAELTRISRNARRTAAGMTERLAACHYLQAVQQPDK